MAQNRRLETLEQLAAASNTDDSNMPALERVGPNVQGADPTPAEEDPHGSAGLQQSAQTQTQVELASQHGIRAMDLWRTDAALSKEAFKPVFKLDGPKDYHPWKFSMIKSLDREGLLSFALGTATQPPYPVSDDPEETRLYFRWKEFNNSCETAILASLGKS